MGAGREAGLGRVEGRAPRQEAAAARALTRAWDGGLLVLVRDFALPRLSLKPGELLSCPWRLPRRATTAFDTRAKIPRGMEADGLAVHARPLSEEGVARMAFWIRPVITCSCSASSASGCSLLSLLRNAIDLFSETRSEVCSASCTVRGRREGSLIGAHMPIPM